MNGVPAFKKSSSDIPGTDIPTLNGFKYGTAGYDISGADDQVPDLRNEMILQGMLGNFDDSDSKNALYDRINELESMLVEKDEEIRTLKEDNRKIKKKAESHESKLREYVQRSKQKELDAMVEGHNGKWNKSDWFDIGEKLE